MGSLWGLLHNLLIQFAGGPGPPENNVVRFGLAAILWAVLLVLAWSRQREARRPRERLLVAGFALALFRELFMLVHVALQVLNGAQHTVFCLVVVPIEHTLTLTSVVLIAGSFIRYILDNPGLARRYLRVGLGTTALIAAFTFVSWPQALASSPALRFHETMAAWFIHLLGSLLLMTAIVVLVRQQGWLRNVVVLALGFFLVSELLVLTNFLTGRAYSQFLCPIGNAFYLCGIPLFGFVYLREQGAEKRRAEEALRAYRHRLEELVDRRTAALQKANQQLAVEVEVRAQAETEVVRRNAELATQIAVAGTISRSLDLDAILNAALQRTLALLGMDAGCVILFAGNSMQPELRIAAQQPTSPALLTAAEESCLCESLARQVIVELAPRLLQRGREPTCCPSLLAEAGAATLLVSTPLVSRGRGLGALTLASTRLPTLSSDVLDLLRAIGQQIGVAVENARLYRQARRWALGMARLNELSLSLNATLDPAVIYRLIAHQAARLLDCSVSLFYTWDEEEGCAREVATYGIPLAASPGCSLLPENSSILADLRNGRRPLQIATAAQDSLLAGDCRERLAGLSLLGSAVSGTSKPVGFLLIGSAISDREWAADEIELLQRFADRAAIALENAYLHDHLEWAAALEERQRIAADMHDGLAQTLGYLNLELGRTHELLEEGKVASALDRFVELQQAIDQANNDVRASIATLHESPPPQRSLQQILQETVARRDRQERAAVTFVTTLRDPLFLSADDTEQVARVVQEAVNNALRHGGAQELRLQLERKAQWYELKIVDDGCGFAVVDGGADGSRGFGLSIMRARAARLGGKLTVDSRPGAGTIITLTWPKSAITTEPFAPASRRSRSAARRGERVKTGRYR